MPPFRPGRELSADFYRDVLAPSLPMPHGAALIGPGSDVLGYDTARSTDHDWGPRATVIVAAADVRDARRTVRAALPHAYDGWPLAIGRDGFSPAHRVEVTTMHDWLVDHLGLDPRDGIDPVGWLVLPAQLLLEATAGSVFADGTGELGRVREQLAGYPDAVWWWLIACQWRRISQEEPFVQRTRELADLAGSGLLVARLARDAMRLALLLARRYPPYAKWIGTAFAALPAPDGLDDLIRAALAEPGSPAGAQALLDALLLLGRRTLVLADGPTERVGRPGPVRFHDRPALISNAEGFEQVALRRVGEPRLRGLPPIGSVDQWVDSTDVLARPQLCRLLRAAYA